jgi:hypothetical protein
MLAEGKPVSTEHFLDNAEKYLCKGDIVLSRAPTFVSWLIRVTTGSPFSHAALVFVVRDPTDGYQNTFLLESTRDGVGIANLRHWIGGRVQQEDLVVLRFKDRDLSSSFFSHVRGLMLDHVKADYDLGRAFRMGLSFLFGAKLTVAKVSSGAKKAMQRAVSRTRFTKWLPPQFICSGFIQYGLVKAAVEEGIDPDRVILREGLTAKSGDALLAVTPDDIAASEKLEWLYVIKNGKVKVPDNREHALAIISGEKR